MSGGHFTASYWGLLEIAEEIEREIARNEERAKTRGHEPDYVYSPEVIERFRETAHTLRQAQAMARRVDWLISGDDGEKSFHKRWEEEVKSPPLSYDEGTRRDAAEVRRFAKHIGYDLPPNMDGHKHPTAQCMSAALWEIKRLTDALRNTALALGAGNAEQAQWIVEGALNTPEDHPSRQAK